MQGLSGPGVGLPLPNSIYPVSLLPNGPLYPNGPLVTIAPGQQLVIPRGTWWVSLGGYSVLQYLDPVTQTWRGFSSARMGAMKVDSDGETFRVANLTGCAIGAIVTAGGTGYVQGSTTVTPSAGNSTWQAIVGGRVNTTVSITASGAGYGVAPMVFIPPPPPPGVQATAVAQISSGTVSTITIINQGAGYQTPPPVSIYPNPTDPNYISGSITSQAAASLTLIGSGVVSAVLCTNPGAPFATVPSLTIAGAGSSATATIVPMWTLTGASIASGGAAYAANAILTTNGGQPTATAAFTNPAVELTGYIPRPARVGLTSAAGVVATVGTIYDGGLFAGTPTAFVLSNSIVTTIATVNISVGSVNDTILLQPTL